MSSLIKLTDEWMCRSKLHMPRKSAFYPSEASVEWKDAYGDKRISGTCLRAAWFRYTGWAEKEGQVLKTEPYSEWIFALGKAVEIILVEQYKQMGIWVANNVEFYNAQYNISGEIDCIVKVPGEVAYGIECCTPNSLILDKNYVLHEFKDFSNNLEAKSIINHLGDENTIANIQIKDVHNEIVYRPRGKFDGLWAEFTGEHPLLIAKVRTSRYIANNKTRSYHFEGTNWKKAKDLEPGDYICIPKAKFGFAKEKLFYPNDKLQSYSYLVGDRWDFSDENGVINTPKLQYPIPSVIKDLYTFYWLIGLYLAEGSCGENTVYFSLHEEEENIINKIKKSIKLLFGLENVFVSKLTDSITGLPSKGVNVRVSSKALVNLFKSIVPGNTRDRTKRLNYEKIIGNPELLSQILLGAWEGDGCSWITEDHNGVGYRISTAVSNLAFLYFQLAAYCGLNPRINKNKQQSQFKSEYIYVVEWSTGGEKHNIEKLVDGDKFWCYKIKKIDVQEYTGKVYNMETNPIHTYTVGCIATHNCKSFYGYAATKQLCGNKSTHPTPKTSQLLQTLIYVDQFKEHLPYFKMIYYARDSANRAEFDIALIEDVSRPDRGVLHRPTINGIADSRFHLEDIYDRYVLLAQYVNENTMPPRDYEKEYNEEKVEKRHKQGEIAKTTYEKWQKKPKQNPIGDWQCNWCRYRAVCYSNH